MQILLLLFLLGCPSGADDTSEAGTRLRVTLFVDDASYLPDDGGADFDVWVAQGLGDHVADGQMQVGDALGLDVPSGTWDVWATFAWVDPEKGGEMDDTADLYVATECSGHTDGVVAVRDETTPVALLAECGDLVTD
ncbi:MAG: hypothetical protein JXB39_15675 [Deltaproteobacteria bacterium]|nr:hypothetical protein [Deltaproteobacteria bacterium]